VETYGGPQGVDKPISRSDWGAHPEDFPEEVAEEIEVPTPDTSYGEGDEIAVFRKVSFVNTDGDLITTQLRIVAEEFGQVAEFAHECKECETVNWIGVGLPTGDYRCVSCVAWLT